jgi:hypothetical protein
MSSEVIFFKVRVSSNTFWRFENTIEPENTSALFGVLEKINQMGSLGHNLTSIKTTHLPDWDETDIFFYFSRDINNAKFLLPENQ